MTSWRYGAPEPLRRFGRNSEPEGLAVKKSPEGCALKFVHRGSYDAMDSTYEAIINHFDERLLEAKSLFNIT